MFVCLCGVCEKAEKLLASYESDSSVCVFDATAKAVEFVVGMSAIVLLTFC